MGVVCPSRGPLKLSPILFNRPSELSKTIGWTFRSTCTFEKIDHFKNDLAIDPGDVFIKLTSQMHARLKKHHLMGAYHFPSGAIQSTRLCSVWE